MDDFNNKLRAGLDEYSSHLDASTLSRLRQARAHALDQRTRRQAPSWRWAAGLTAVAAGVLGIHLATSRLADSGMNDRLNGIVEISLIEEDMELVDELDFYTWLDGQG